MNGDTRSKCRRRGFTLVELLVTVGIIVLLIAILVPVLGRARAHVNEVRCLSHQRQLMQAMLSYAGDNEGYLPAPNWDGGAMNAALPPGWLYTPRLLTASNTFQQTDAKNGTLYQYLNSLDVFRCTIDDGNWNSNTVQVVTSYIMNGAVCDYNSSNPLPEKLRAFKPTAILLWEIPADISSDSGVVNDGADQPREEITTRHFHGSTIGFADGHSELMTWTEFTNEWFNAGNAPGRLWCAPHSSKNDGGASLYSPFPSSPPSEPANSG